MTKGESITSSETQALVSRLAQAVEESIAYANELAKQVAFKHESAILGLRSQIVDNVTILLPYLKTSSKATGAAIGNGATVHVITVGQKPAVRACVFSGGTNMPMKLIHSAEATDTTTALTSLMENTQSMLAAYLNYSPKIASTHAKVDSGVAASTPARSPKGFSSKLTNRATAAFSIPAKSPIAKLKAEARGEAKTQHARNESETGFFDAAQVNNKTFLETCGEPNIDGKDSAFLSRDGEVHPNRSFVKLAGAAAPAEEDDGLFF